MHRERWRSPSRGREPTPRCCHLASANSPEKQQQPRLPIEGLCDCGLELLSSVVPSNRESWSRSWIDRELIPRVRRHSAGWVQAAGIVRETQDPASTDRQLELATGRIGRGTGRQERKLLDDGRRVRIGCNDALLIAAVIV